MSALTSTGNVLPIAHAGHWLVKLMYLAPVVGFLGWLGVVSWRERHEAADEQPTSTITKEP